MVKLKSNIKSLKNKESKAKSFSKKPIRLTRKEKEAAKAEKGYLVPAFAKSYDFSQAAVDILNKVKEKKPKHLSLNEFVNKAVINYAVELFGEEELDPRIFEKNISVSLVKIKRLERVVSTIALTLLHDKFDEFEKLIDDFLEYYTEIENLTIKKQIDSCIDKFDKFKSKSEKYLWVSLIYAKKHKLI